jgi:hypothetical protein
VKQIYAFLGGNIKYLDSEVYRWFPIDGRVVLPANASQVRKIFGISRCSSALANGVSKDAHTTAAKMDGGTKDLSTADFQSAVALCFQPTLLESEKTFGI